MLSRTAALAVAVVAVLSAAALTGCTASAPEAADTPAAVEPVGEPTAEPTPIDIPTPAPTPECRRAGGDVVPGEPLDPKRFEDMVDLGPREGANGTVNYAADGTLASYLVAANDYNDAILDRLCIGAYPYNALNAVRRGTLYSIDPTHQAYLTPLYVGDTLNLSPYTITSVGDVNGEVRSYGASFILPPQR